MFPKISESDFAQIKAIHPEKSKDYLQNFYFFTDQLLGLFPKNDFLSLWTIYSFSFIQELLDKYEIKESVNDDPGCFLEGEKLLDVSFVLQIPETFFRFLEYKKKIGRFGEVGKELATIYLFFPKEEILKARESSVIKTFQVERNFARIDLSVDFNGNIEIDIYQNDSFKEQNMISYRSFYEVYFENLKEELQKLDLNESSKIKFWSIGDKYPNGHSRDVSCIEAKLDLKDTLSILRLIYSFGFNVGDFPKI